MPELDPRERRPAARVVEQLPHDPAEVPFALVVVELAELRGPFALVGVGGEDGPLAAALREDDFTHGGREREKEKKEIGWIRK